MFDFFFLEKNHFEILTFIRMKYTTTISYTFYESNTAIVYCMLFLLWLVFTDWKPAVALWFLVLSLNPDRIKKFYSFASTGMWWAERCDVLSLWVEMWKLCNHIEETHYCFLSSLNIQLYNINQLSPVILLVKIVRKNSGGNIFILYNCIQDSGIKRTPTLSGRIDF